MKKKGFTLVELLAVIAILAILVIIALPNVIQLFKNAQKNSFANEAREVLRQAQNQWLLDGLSTGDSMTYSSTGTKLNLDGRALTYTVVVSNTGEVSSLMVCDGSHKITKNTSPVTITSILNTDVVEVTSCS